jgi:hypothetical protein
MLGEPHRPPFDRAAQRKSPLCVLRKMFWHVRAVQSTILGVMDQLVQPRYRQTYSQGRAGRLNTLAACHSKYFASG